MIDCIQQTVLLSLSGVIFIETCSLLLIQFGQVMFQGFVFLYSTQNKKNLVPTIKTFTSLEICFIVQSCRLVSNLGMFE